MGEPVLSRLLSFVPLFVLTHASLAFDHTYQIKFTDYDWKLNAQ